MRKELQDNLYKKYPKLFSQKDLPMSQTCMCWGIECGDGWYGIIDKFCDKLTKYLETVDIGDVTFSQVKEKYGSIRVYTDGGDDVVYDMISDLEDESEKVCMMCGTTPSKIRNHCGWYTSMCDSCDVNTGKVVKGNAVSIVEENKECNKYDKQYN